MQNKESQKKFNELLLCPFCGGEAMESYNNFMPCLMCRECGAMMTIPMAWKGNYKIELAKKWNTRKTVERIVERLKKESYQEFCDSPRIVDLKDAIEIVREEGGLNEKV